MFRIRKLKTFEMAHVLSASYSKECQQVHGHSYSMEVIIEASEVDLNGMVMDFKKLNEILQPIMVKFDHKIVLEGKQETFTGRETILTCNPTAENMAKWIWNAICHEVRFESPTATKLIIRLHETATGWAEYEQELK